MNRRSFISLIAGLFLGLILPRTTLKTPVWKPERYIKLQGGVYIDTLNSYEVYGLEEWNKGVVKTTANKEGLINASDT